MRTTGTDVTIILTGEEAHQVEVAASEVEYLLSQAASAFELLHVGISCGHLDPESSGPLAIMELARRAMVSATEQEGAILGKLAVAIRAASASRPMEAEDTA